MHLGSNRSVFIKRLDILVDIVIVGNVALHTDTAEETLTDDTAVAVPLSLQVCENRGLLVGLPLVVIVINKHRLNGAECFRVTGVNAVLHGVFCGVFRHRVVRVPECPVNEIVADDLIPVAVAKAGLGLVRKLNRLVDHVPRINGRRVALAVHEFHQGVNVAVKSFEHRLAIHEAYRVKTLEKLQSRVLLKLLRVSRNRNRLVALAECLLGALAVPYHYVSAHFDAVCSRKIKHHLRVRIDDKRKVILLCLRTVPTHVVSGLQLVRAGHAGELLYDQSLLVGIPDFVVRETVVDALHRRSDPEIIPVSLFQCFICHVFYPLSFL